MTTGGKSSRWGVGVWIVWGGFAAVILALASIASVQRIDLVEDSYYERGLVYQARLDQLVATRAQGLVPKVTHDPQNRSVRICFRDTTPLPATGTILCFRPSDARSDVSVSFTLDADRCVEIADNRLTSGYWKFKCDWADSSGRHYAEESLFID